MVYIVEEHMYLMADLVMAIGFASSSWINDSNEMLGCKLLQLIHVPSIKDGALRFFKLRVKKKYRVIASIRSKIDA